MADDAPFDPADASPAATDPRGASDGAAPDIDELKRDRDETYDRLLRKTAEFDNYRRRIERERREQGDQAVVDLLGQLLSIVDDFDRALTVEAGPEAAAYRKGVELIHAKMNDLLRRYNVRPFDAVGADFDPNMHQAVMHEVSEDHREGEVMGELQKGYMLGDKLLRPAMVKVAKS
jgi:molecular chaperone GrpE